MDRSAPVEEQIAYLEKGADRIEPAGELAERVRRSA